MKTKTDDSPALNFLQTCWDAIPRRSWRNRNGAMQEALKTAISSGMEFSPDDFKQIYDRFNAFYWIGESKEVYYSIACRCQSGTNLPAAIAWETYVGRPAVLWAEKTRTRERLYVGARFKWDGLLLTVTSMAGEELIGCTYEGDRVVKRRVRVKYEDIRAVRKAFDDRRRGWEKEISMAKTLAELDAIAYRFSDEERALFRHFDVEMIRELYRKVGNAIREKMSWEERQQHEQESKERAAATHDADLARWMVGEAVSRHFDVVRLRRRGDWVETTTGQRATVAGVRAALPFVQRYRKKGWHSNGSTHDLDEYPIHKVDAKGVKVGCTFVEWSEIDRIAPLLDGVPNAS